MGEDKLADRDALRRFVESALPEARKHAEIVEKMKSALIQHNDRLALQYARQLCGIDQLPQ